MFLAFRPSEGVLGKLGYSSGQDIQIEVRGERGPTTAYAGLPRGRGPGPVTSGLSGLPHAV